MWSLLKVRRLHYLLLDVGIAERHGAIWQGSGGQKTTFKRLGQTGPDDYCVTTLSRDDWTRSLIEFTLKKNKQPRETGFESEESWYVKMSTADQLIGEVTWCVLPLSRPIRCEKRVRGRSTNRKISKHFMEFSKKTHKYGNINMSKGCVFMYLFVLNGIFIHACFYLCTCGQKGDYFPNVGFYAAYFKEQCLQIICKNQKLLFSQRKS